MSVLDLPVIRVHACEYANIPDEDLYHHFNLAPAFHEVGTVYALPRIVRRGSASSGGEILPLLDHEGCRVARCVGFRSHIPFEDLDESDFVHSMVDLRSVEALQDRIVERYARLRPGLDRRSLLALGVSGTMLRFEGP